MKHVKQILFRIRWLNLASLVALLVVVAVVLSPVQAQEPVDEEMLTTDEVSASEDITASAQSDDSRLEVGTWYINRFRYGRYCIGSRCWTSSPGYLRNTDNDAVGFGRYAKKYSNAYWKWHVGNGSAKEDHWKAYNKGGNEHRVLDQIDFAYISTHGSADGVYFGTNADDIQLSYSDCRDSWGNGDLDWVAFSACQTMESATSMDRWASCMNGLRLILGFKTVMGDSPKHGAWFGYFLARGKNMSKAWWLAVVPQ